MKNKSFRTLTLCAIALMLLVCTGCPREVEIPDSQGIQFIYQDMPYDAIGKSATILCYDSTGNYISEVILGTITSAQQTFSKSLPQQTASCVATISSGLTINYFVILDTSNGIGSRYTVNGYWRIKTNSEDLKKPQYAVSTNDISSAQCGILYNYNPSVSVYYAYKFEGVRGKDLKITCSDCLNLNIYYSSDQNDLLQQSTSFTPWMSATSYSADNEKKDIKVLNNYSSDTLYLLIRPYDYNRFESSKGLICVSDVTNTNQKCIPKELVRNVQPISSTEYLFTGYESGETSFYILNGTTGNVTATNETYNGIVNYMIPFDEGVLFANLDKIYYYKPGNVPELKLDIGNNQFINGLCLAGEELFILAGTFSSSSSPFMCSTSTWQLTKQDSSVVLNEGSSFVYIPQQQRVYFIEKINSSYQLTAIWWDITENKFKTEHATSSVKAPLARFGSDNTLICGNGRTFSIEPGTYYLHEISNQTLNSDYANFTDIVFNGDYFYISKGIRGGYGSDVFKFKKTDLSAPVANMGYWVYPEEVMKLLVTSDEVQLVTKERADKDGTQFLVGVTKLDFDLQEKE